MGIQLHDPRQYESKSGVRERRWEFTHQVRVALAKLRSWTRLRKFIGVGATGSVIDLLVFSLLLNAFGLRVARALAIWVAMTWNFVWNRRVTFADRRDGRVARQYLLFCSACLVGALLNWSTCVGLCHFNSYFAQHPLIAAGIGVFIGVAFNYAASCRFVFRRQ